MASGKKSFVLYCDLIHTVDLLDDVLAGKLIKHILSYVNDQNPETDDILLKIAFEPIKHQLKRDLKEWDVIKEDRSVAGKLGNLKRWNKDLYDKVIKEEISIQGAEEIAKHRKATNLSQTVANVAVNVNDNVTVNDNVLLQKKVKNEFSSNFKARGEEVMAKRLREGIEAANNAGNENSSGTK